VGVANTTLTILSANALLKLLCTNYGKVLASSEISEVRMYGGSSIREGGREASEKGLGSTGLAARGVV